MVWAPDYITRDDLKNYLRIPLADTADDDFIDVCRSSASRCIDTESRRQFGQVAAAESREYEYGEMWLEPPRYRQYMFFRVDDFQDLTGLVIMRESVDVTADAKFYPLNAIQEGKPHTEIRLPYGDCEIEVTALWGWSAVPQGIENATRILAGRFFTRRDAPFGVLGSPEVGNQFRIPANDGDVRVAIKPYYRWV